MSAEINDEFDNLLEALRSSSETADAATEGLEQRDWMYPPLNEWSGDPQDVTGMNSAFSRDDLNKMYDDALQDTQGKGKTGDCAATKLMVDYIAVAERAFRTRWASRIRCMMHSAGRRAGHGDPLNSLYNDVRTYIQSILSAGGVEVPPPED